MYHRLNDRVWPIDCPEQLSFFDPKRAAAIRGQRDGSVEPEPWARALHRSAADIMPPDCDGPPIDRWDWFAVSGQTNLDGITWCRSSRAARFGPAGSMRTPIDYFDLKEIEAGWAAERPRQQHRVRSTRDVRQQCRSGHNVPRPPGDRLGSPALLAG
jgi:hypothetical protein